MSFVRNQWYVAAHSAEVGRALLARTILDEPLVLYRTSDGRRAALADRCVHRHFPLSASQLHGDTIVCGYHGFTYGPDGRCVAVPGQQRIPRTARVVAYPVAEQDSLVWVWIGDPGRADTGLIPRAPWLDAGEYTTVRGIEPLAAGYELLVDNLLDLSHETYLHGGYIGTPTRWRIPRSVPRSTIRQWASGVRTEDGRRRVPAVLRALDRDQRAHGALAGHRISPPLPVPAAQPGGPGRLLLPRPDGTDPDGFHLEVVYAITPSTETSTYDFWAVARDFALGDPDVSAFLHDSNRTVVLQDVAALNALEKVIATEPPGVQG